MQIERSNYLGHEREIPDAAPAWAKARIMEARAAMKAGTYQPIQFTRAAVVPGLGPQGEPLLVDANSRLREQLAAVSLFLEHAKQAGESPGRSASSRKIFCRLTPSRERCSTRTITTRLGWPRLMGDSSTFTTYSRAVRAVLSAPLVLRDRKVLQGAKAQPVRTVRLAQSARQDVPEQPAQPEEMAEMEATARTGAMGATESTAKAWSAQKANREATSESSDRRSCRALFRKSLRAWQKMPSSFFRD